MKIHSLLRKYWVIAPIIAAYYMTIVLFPTFKLERFSFIWIVMFIITVLLIFLSVYLYSIFMALLSKRSKWKIDDK